MSKDTLWVRTSFIVAGLFSALLILSLPGLASGSTPRTLEAEEMNRSAGKIVKGKHASGGKSVLLSRTSQLSRKTALPETERVIVRARAQQCKGAPTMVVKIDGKNVLSRKVTSRTWSEYAHKVDVSSGSRMVQIQFTNAAETRQCRRALHIDKLTFIPGKPVSEPPTEPPPTEPPPTEPPPVSEAKPDCKVSLQGMLKNASSGGVITTPGDCIFRETLTINKPITLIAGPGAEIRGSDVWDDWETSGSLWRSVESYPELAIQERWRCKKGTDRCRKPEQVFIDDGELELVSGAPDSGEFALDGERRILLADDPADVRVEVTVRDRWIAGASPNVTIDGFTMRHSANEGIKNDLHARWAVKNCDLGFAHSVNLALSRGPGMLAQNNYLHHAGQMGFAANDGEIRLIGNEIAYNNTKDFDPGWEAGAMKISQTHFARIEDNHVHHNYDFGIWTDVIQEGSQRVEIVGNRVHHHKHQGIRVEITKNVLVADNVVYENGVDHPGDPNSGAGIGFSGSFDILARDNFLSDNRNGLVVVNADRAPYDHVEDVQLEHNTIIQKSGRAISWYKAVEDGNIFDRDAGNGSSNNLYWYPGGEKGEGSDVRYKWVAGHPKLSEYMKNAADTGSRYMSNEEMNEALEQNPAL